MVLVRHDELAVCSLPEQIVHHVLVTVQTVLWQVAGGKHDDVIHALTIVT